jgi:hypothetical protein
MNHRDMWHPEKYTTKTRATQVQLPEESELRMTLLRFRQETGIDDKMRRQTVKKKCLKYHLKIQMSK